MGENGTEVSTCPVGSRMSTTLIPKGLDARRSRTKSAVSATVTAYSIQVSSPMKPRTLPPPSVAGASFTCALNTAEKSSASMRAGIGLNTRPLGVPTHSQAEV